MSSLSLLGKLLDIFAWFAFLVSLGISLVGIVVDHSVFNRFCYALNLAYYICRIYFGVTGDRDDETLS